MDVVETVAGCRSLLDRARAAGRVVGLVPTMGALHDGHRSLMARARAECDVVAVSIFVNPLQVGDAEDMEHYPRTLERDLLVCAEAGADVVFVPALREMYPSWPAAPSTTVSAGGVSDAWEGASRPGHFDGVATVVAKLLVAGRADRAYFGRKDAQQLAVVQRLARDLDTGVAIVACPLVRDADGLALSSRNVYLTPEDRAQALAIPRGLAAAATLWAAGERRAATLVEAVRRELESSPGIAPDYVAVVDPESFVEVAEAARGCQIVVAGRMAAARLIDTIRLGYDPIPGVAAAVRSNTTPGSAEWSSPCSVS